MSDYVRLRKIIIFIFLYCLILASDMIDQDGNPRPLDFEHETDDDSRQKQPRKESPIDKKESAKLKRRALILKHMRDRFAK